MELKEAYKKAFTDELKPLIESGKITVLGTLEEVAEDLAESFANAAKKGAKLSEDKWDDVVIPPAMDFMLSRMAPHIDKIDGKEG